MSDQNIPFEVTRARRAGARLAAVQALYEMEQTGKSTKATVRAFMEAKKIAPKGRPLARFRPFSRERRGRTRAHRPSRVDRA